MKTVKVIPRDFSFTKTLLILLTAVMSSAFLYSQNQSADKTLSPYFLVRGENPDVDKLPLQSTSAIASIAGVIADVRINQVYKNEGNTPLEAIYVFPASSNAAVYAMEMTLGSRTIYAKIEEKEKARKDYEDAIKDGRRASLLEQKRPNVFQMNVGNIQPGDIITVSLKYTELLIPENGTYSFVYPTVTGPRFTYESNDETDKNDNYNQPPYQSEGELPYYDFNIEVWLSGGLPIQSLSCPTHQVDVKYNTASYAHVKLDELEIEGGNRDFILNYQLAGKKIESGLLLYEHKDEKFFLMIVQPPKQIKPEDIPPREYIFIVDVSGSMHGFPLRTSKTLLRNLVVNLNPTDKFNVLLFAGRSGWLSEESVYATPKNIEKAMYVIDNQYGGGSTMLLPALKKALKFPRSEESLSRSFVIVTDGYVSVEKQAFDLIRNHANEANTFAFGIGSGVNRYIIEGLAHVGNGEPMIITKPEEAAAQAEKFRNYISNPVFTQIRANFGGFDVYDVEPVSIPDVLAERPVIIFGKYKGEPKGKITISGYSGKNPYKITYEVEKEIPNDENAAIRYLWARKRIQLLDDYRRLRHEDSKEILELGLKYNLLTAYTSFVAIDSRKIKNSDGELVTVEQVVPLPKGVSNYAVGCDMTISGVSKGKHHYLNMIAATSVDAEESIELDSSPTIYNEKKLETNIRKRLKYAKRECKIKTKITVNIYLTVDGKVSKVEISSFAGTQAEECLKKKIKAWDFSKYNLNSEIKFNIEI